MSGVRVTPADLQMHLFAALERLGDESLEGDALRDEIDRSRAVAQIARVAVDNCRTVIDAAKFKDGRVDPENRMGRMLGDGE